MFRAPGASGPSARVRRVRERLSRIPNSINFSLSGPKNRIGLMAEDFHEIFGRGSEKYLNGDEVQMALWLAVKQLTTANQELVKRVADLESRLQENGSAQN